MGSSANMLQVSQVLLVCFGALAELLGNCGAVLRQMTAPDWSIEERGTASEAEQFTDFLRGLDCLRCLLWRLALAAELLLPPLGVDGLASVKDAGDVPAQDAETLKELHNGARTRLSDAEAAWARVEKDLKGLELALGPWSPADCLEAGAAGAARSTPLCTLCLLPAGLEAGGVAT